MSEGVGKSAPPPAGDARAARFEELYREHASDIQGYLIRRLGNAAIASDLLQEVFLAAWRQLHRLQADVREGAWLVAIAKNLLRGHYAKRGREKRLVGRLLPMAAAEPNGQTESRERRIMAGWALLSPQLPRRRNAILRMFYLQGHSCCLIAEYLGMSSQAVRKDLSRGRRARRRLLMAPACCA